MNKINKIITLYIYHYIDNAKLNCYGLIKYTNTDITPHLYPGWKLYGIFYAFSPLLRPIPDGTKLFSTKIKNYFPYNTTKYKLKYDIFNIHDDDPYYVNFITYNRPILNTKALYFHMIGDNIFPSFEKNPPNDNPNWNISGINPIYVMTTNQNNFYCNNGRCLPEPMKSNTFGKNLLNNIDIDKCLTKCKGGVGILQTIKKYKNIKYKIKNNLSVIIFCEIIIIFILFLKLSIL